MRCKPVERPFGMTDSSFLRQAVDARADRRGFLWIGTWGGLNRYDGASFTSFAHNPSDLERPAPPGVFSLYEDRAGVLWAGSWYNGIFRLDPDTERFTQNRHNPDDAQSISNDEVRGIV